MKNNQPQTLTAGPTPWLKLKTDKKIERMREIIKEKEQEQINLRQQFDQLRNEFLGHLHKNDLIVQSIQGNYGMGECRGIMGTTKNQNPDEVYF